jgi:YihY family inner membrane protein
MNVTERFDRYQRDHTWLGYPIAVVYKFGDDRSPHLAAMVTYYGFVSLFPLLLLFYSALGFFLQGHSAIRRQLEHSAVANFSVIGPQLEHNISGFHGSGIALVIGVLGTMYGGLGAMQAAQAAFNKIYAVPRNSQPDPIKSRMRSIGLILLLGGAVLLSTGIGALSTVSNSAELGEGLRLLGYALSFAINVALFTAAYQLLTARELHIRDVVTGGLIAGAAWEVLQTVGTYYLSHELTHSNDLYGTFGLILAAIAWIYLSALVLMISAEINVVLRQRLWPRALLTPFTDNVELTEPDRRAYTMYAMAERFKGFETVHIDFGLSAARPEVEAASQGGERPDGNQPPTGASDGRQPRSRPEGHSRPSGRNGAERPP